MEGNRNTKLGINTFIPKVVFYRLTGNTFTGPPCTLVRECESFLGKISYRPGQEHLGQNVSARHNSTKERKDYPSSRLGCLGISTLSGKTSHMPCGISKEPPSRSPSSLCALTCTLRTQGATALDTPVLPVRCGLVSAATILLSPQSNRCMAHGFCTGCSLQSPSCPLL